MVGGKGGPKGGAVRGDKVDAVHRAYPSKDVWVQQIFHFLIMNFKEHDAHSTARCALLSINGFEQLPATIPNTIIHSNAFELGLQVTQAHTCDKGFCSSWILRKEQPDVTIAANNPIQPLQQRAARCNHCSKQPAATIAANSQLQPLQQTIRCKHCSEQSDASIAANSGQMQPLQQAASCNHCSKQLDASIAADSQMKPLQHKARCQHRSKQPPTVTTLKLAPHQRHTRQDESNHHIH